MPPYLDMYLNKEAFLLILQDIIKVFIFEVKFRNSSERDIREYNNNILKFVRYM